MVSMQILWPEIGRCPLNLQVFHSWGIETREDARGYAKSCKVWTVRSWDKAGKLFSRSLRCESAAGDQKESNTPSKKG